MNTKEEVQSLPEYVNVPLAELVESSTNPRKTFDDERLEELAESIRSKGVLSPLLARKVNGHFEIVSGARRYRAAQRAGLREVPVRIVAPNDEEALETQIIENIQRADVHPFEEAQGFRALLEREGAGYTVEKIAARTGKACRAYRQAPSALGPDSTCGRCVHGGTHRHRARFAHRQARSGRAGRGLAALL